MSQTVIDMTLQGLFTNINYTSCKLLTMIIQGMKAKRF